jgi:hypothetical protein
VDAGRVVNTWEQIVWAITPIAQAAVLASVILRGILREFRVFAVYLIVDMLLTAIWWWLGRNPDTDAYREVWVATQPLLLVFQTLVVLDFYRLLYRSYPGIQAFARVLILVAIGVALAITFATVQLDVHRIVWRVPDVQRLFVVKRVVSSLLGFLMFTTMAFFPKAPSARNILLHGWLLAVLFIAAAGGFFGINFGLATAWMGALFMTVQLGCFVIWAVALRSPYAKAKPSAEAMARTERWNKDLMLFAKWLVRDSPGPGEI